MEICCEQFLKLQEIQFGLLFCEHGVTTWIISNSDNDDNVMTSAIYKFIYLLTYYNDDAN